MVGLTLISTISIVTASLCVIGIRSYGTVLSSGLSTGEHKPRASWSKNETLTWC